MCTQYARAGINEKETSKWFAVGNKASDQLVAESRKNN